MVSTTLTTIAGGKNPTGNINGMQQTTTGAIGEPTNATANTNRSGRQQRSIITHEQQQHQHDSLVSPSNSSINTSIITTTTSTGLICSNNALKYYYKLPEEDDVGNSLLNGLSLNNSRHNPILNDTCEFNHHINNYNNNNNNNHHHHKNNNNNSNNNKKSKTIFQRYYNGRQKDVEGDEDPDYADDADAADAGADDDNIATAPYDARTIAANCTQASPSSPSPPSINEQISLLFPKCKPKINNNSTTAGATSYPDVIDINSLAIDKQTTDDISTNIENLNGSLKMESQSQIETNELYRSASRMAQSPPTRSTLSISSESLSSVTTPRVSTNPFLCQPLSTNDIAEDECRRRTSIEDGLELLSAPNYTQLFTQVRRLSPSDRQQQQSDQTADLLDKRHSYEQRYPQQQHKYSQSNVIHRHSIRNYQHTNANPFIRSNYWDVQPLSSSPENNDQNVLKANDKHSPNAHQQRLGHHYKNDREHADSIRKSKKPLVQQVESRGASNQLLESAVSISSMPSASNSTNQDQHYNRNREQAHQQNWDQEFYELPSKIKKTVRDLKRHSTATLRNDYLSENHKKQSNTNHQIKGYQQSEQQQDPKQYEVLNTSPVYYKNNSWQNLIVRMDATENLVQSQANTGNNSNSIASVTLANRTTDPAARVSSDKINNMKLNPEAISNDKITNNAKVEYTKHSKYRNNQFPNNSHTLNTNAKRQHGIIEYDGSPRRIGPGQPLTFLNDQDLCVNRTSTCIEMPISNGNSLNQNHMTTNSSKEAAVHLPGFPQRIVTSSSRTVKPVVTQTPSTQLAQHACGNSKKKLHQPMKQQLLPQQAYNDNNTEDTSNDVSEIGTISDLTATETVPNTITLTSEPVLCASPATLTNEIVSTTATTTLPTDTIPATCITVPITASNPLNIPAKSSSTFDYLYEFSETRKVLEEFFKCPSIEDKPLAENISDVDSIDIQYEFQSNLKRDIDISNRNNDDNNDDEDDDENDDEDNDDDNDDEDDDFEDVDADNNHMGDEVAKTETMNSDNDENQIDFIEDDSLPLSIPMQLQDVRSNIVHNDIDEHKILLQKVQAQAHKQGQAPVQPQQLNHKPHLLTDSNYYREHLQSPTDDYSYKNHKLITQRLNQKDNRQCNTEADANANADIDADADDDDDEERDETGDEDAHLEFRQQQICQQALTHQPSQYTVNNRNGRYNMGRRRFTTSPLMRDFDFFLDSASRSSGEQYEQFDCMNANQLSANIKQNYRYSPETTDCDSNCGDLDSLSSELNMVSTSCSNYTKYYAATSMPVLEDGLSSGHTSDTENNNQHNLLTQTNALLHPTAVNGSTGNAMLNDIKYLSNNNSINSMNNVTTSTSDGGGCSTERKTTISPNLLTTATSNSRNNDSLMNGIHESDPGQNSLRNINSYERQISHSAEINTVISQSPEISTNTKIFKNIDSDLDSLYSINVFQHNDMVDMTPPPPAPAPHRKAATEGDTLQTNSFRENRCNKNLSNSPDTINKSNHQNSTHNTHNSETQIIIQRQPNVTLLPEYTSHAGTSSPIVTSPIWLSRHLEINSSHLGKRSIDNLSKNPSADEDEVDTDLETDRLLGHQRLDDQGYYEENKSWDRKPSRSLLSKISPKEAAANTKTRNGYNALLSSTPEIPPQTLPKNSANNKLLNMDGATSSSEHSEKSPVKISLQADCLFNANSPAANSCNSQSFTKDAEDGTNNIEKLAAINSSGSGDNGTDSNNGSIANATTTDKKIKKSKNNEGGAVLIEGVLFRAKYLGSTQLVCEGQPTKSTRMMQAEEAVSRIKALAPDGDIQPSTDVDLFISTEKIMVLNTDLKEIMMDHALRTISYIADIGDLVVLMARRRFVPQDIDDAPKANRTPKMICHVFESDEAQFIAQSIGQAFQVAYMEFLKANGIEDHRFVKEMDYQEVLNSQEIFGDELEIFAKKELQKEVVVPKSKGEILGVVIVESGWGSMLPTVVIANLMSSGAAARCGQLNIGDQLIAINGLSLVGLPLSTCQNYIKNTKNQTVVKFTVVPCPPVVEVKIKRPETKYQLGFSVQNGVICSLLRGGIAERGGVRVGHRIIEINNQSVVAVPHEKIVNLLATSVGEILMKTMPTSMFRLLTGQENPIYI